MKKKQKVDLIIEKLIENKKFLKHIKSTNKKILKDPSKFINLGKKYEKIKKNH